MLVLLHGSRVDEVRTARDPGLVAELEEHGWLLCAPFGRVPGGWYLGSGGTDVFEALEAAAVALPVDRTALFLGGISTGGFGAWWHGLANSDRFAGLVVLSGLPTDPVAAGLPSTPPGDQPAVGSYDPAAHLGRAAGLPVFVVHGAADPVFPVEATRRFVEDLRAAGADVVYRELEGTGHADYSVWPEIFDWMEQVRERAAPPGSGRRPRAG